MSNFQGAPYPITKNARGFFHTQNGIDQVKSDLLILLLTNPGERVMLPQYGTPLRKLLFDPNDPTTVDKAREMVIDSIRTWEPRIAVQNVTVTSNIDERLLSPMDTKEQTDHILSIVIDFYDPDNIKDVQQLVLEVPLSGKVI